MQEIIQVDDQNQHQYQEIDKVIEQVTGIKARKHPSKLKYDGVYVINGQPPLYVGRPFLERRQIHSEQLKKFKSFVKTLPPELTAKRSVTIRGPWHGPQDYIVSAKTIDFRMRQYIKRFNRKKRYTSNWYRRDIMVLVWVLQSYCLINHVRLRELKDEDLEAIAEFYPTMSSYDLKYRWAYYRHYILNRKFKFEPWTLQEEHELWRLTVKKHVPIKKVRRVLYQRGEGKYPARCQVQIYVRFFMLQARKQAEKKGVFKKWAIWSPYSDMHLLLNFIRFGKKYKMIAANMPRPQIYSPCLVHLRMRILISRMGAKYSDPLSKLQQLAIRYLQTLRYISFDAEQQSVAESLPTSVHISDLNQDDIAAIRRFLQRSERQIGKTIERLSVHQLEALDDEQYNSHTNILQSNFVFNEEPGDLDIPKFVDVEEYLNILEQEEEKKSSQANERTNQSQQQV